MLILIIPNKLLLIDIGPGDNISQVHEVNVTEE